MKAALHLVSSTHAVCLVLQDRPPILKQQLSHISVTPSIRSHPNLCYFVYPSTSKSPSISPHRSLRYYNPSIRPHRSICYSVYPFTPKSLLLQQSVYTQISVTSSIHSHPNLHLSVHTEVSVTILRLSVHTEVSVTPSIRSHSNLCYSNNPSTSKFPFSCPPYNTTHSANSPFSKQHFCR